METLAETLRASEHKVEELERSLTESRKTEADLRNGLAHQQSVHEALQKETSTCHEVRMIRTVCMYVCVHKALQKETSTCHEVCMRHIMMWHMRNV